MSAAFLVAARRTAVAPRGGALRAETPWTLAAALVGPLCADAGLAPDAIEDVVLGNALGAGGNVARMAALAAGLADATPAATLDTQCCAGLDAILLAAARVKAGEADVVLAGGCESFSTAPLRALRPQSRDAAPAFYDRPPFAPDPARDADLAHSAAALAAARGFTRAAQEAFAAKSHRKALGRAAQTGEIVGVAGFATDPFAREMSPSLLRRLPVLAGDPAHGLTAATIAVEADAAAAVLVVSARTLARLAPSCAVRIAGGRRIGGAPEAPALAPIAAARAVLETAGVRAEELACAEIMEAYAPQAMAAIADLALREDQVNRGGGALARGHPIGASGAVLAVRLFHELAAERAGASGLAAIAAAGGLGSAAIFSRV